MLSSNTSNTQINTLLKLTSFDLETASSVSTVSSTLNLLTPQHNASHRIIAQKIKCAYLNAFITNAQKQNDSSISCRIPFKTKINPDQINTVLNLNVFNSVPTTSNLFANYENKKNALLKNKTKVKPKIATYNNNNSYNSSNNNNSGVSSYSNKNLYSCGGSYMDTKPVYLKKKKMMQYEDDIEEEDGGSGNGMLSYTNSIYNINRKKKKNNNNYKGRKYDYDEEDEDDEYQQSQQQQQNKFVGFQSAITITNKVLKNNKVCYEYNNNNYNNNNNNSNTNNENNNYVNTGMTSSSNTSYKKFVPPFKKNNNNTSVSKTPMNNDDNNNNEKDKEKELDEKLKGFDKKMLEFIESEILSTSPNVSWDDIAGLEFAKKTIKEIIIWPLMRPDIFTGIRRPPKGLLLFGPPGTGKTMIAKAIASQSHSHFFNISASSLMSKWIGESERLVRTLFALASFHQPSVVFIDEIDSILTSRSENECESSRRIKTEFLVQLDGAGTNSEDRILIIGATNRPQEIDDAFIRRLSKRLYIPLPNKESRKQLIMNVLKKEREKNSKYDITDDDIDLIVNMTKGYSGSDMINVCREAAMMPIRTIVDIEDVNVDNLRGVNKEDFMMSLHAVKPSVSDKTIGQYIDWNKEFGSFQFEEKDE